MAMSRIYTFIWQMRDKNICDKSWDIMSKVAMLGNKSWQKMVKSKYVKFSKNREL